MRFIRHKSPETSLCSSATFILVGLVASIGIIQAQPAEPAAPTNGAGSSVARPTSGIKIKSRRPVPPRPPKVLPPKPPARPVKTFKVRGVVPPPEVLAGRKLPSQPVSTTFAPLGLKRLQASPDGKPAAVAAAKYDVEALTLPPGAAGLRSQTQHGVSYLVLDGGREWSRPLRGSPQEIVFVSFVLNAGISTAIDIAGAQLRIEASATAGFADVVVGNAASTGASDGRRPGYRVRLDTFGGQALAPLPLFTVRLDPKAGVWDIFSGFHPVALHLPLSTGDGNGTRKLSVKAGDAGAWICGLVVSDENPLFADANSNGIDDAFEIEKRGSLAKAGEPSAERKALVTEWRRARPTQPKVLRFPRPLPDRFVAALSAPKK